MDRSLTVFRLHKLLFLIKNNMRKIGMFGLIALFLLSACKERVNETVAGTVLGNKYLEKFNDEEGRRELIEKVLQSGDTLAYKRLSDIYFGSGYSTEFFYLAFIMANNYDYPQAYYDLYGLLDYVKGRDLKSDSLALYYLLCAYEKGLNEANVSVEGKFEVGHIPKASSYFLTIKK